MAKVKEPKDGALTAEEIIAQQLGADPDPEPDGHDLVKSMELEIMQLRLATARIEHEAAQRRLEEASTAKLPTLTEMVETDELRAVQLQTALLQLEEAKDKNQKFIETREEKIAKRKRRQGDLQAGQRVLDNVRKKCRHRVGGFGLADAYRGGKENVTAVIECALPIAGMKLFYCTRCGDEAITPDRNLRKTDPELYTEQMEKFEKFEELMRDSYNATPMGGPQFAFEKDGIPFHPPII